MAFSLIVYSPVLRAVGEPHFVMDVTPNPRYPREAMRARTWRRSIRGIGGYWQGEFTLYGELDDLARFFYEFLGYHIVERSSGYKTWEGMIYEMDFTSDGTTRRRTLDSLYNHVRVRYQDTGNNITTTAAAEDTESQRIFGERQLIWPLTGQDQAAAEATRDSLLAEHSWPRGRQTGMSLGTIGGEELLIRTCGYVFTANWQYESAGDDTDDELSTWVSEIVSTDCPYLQIANIVTNTTTVRKSNKRDMRAWDVITKLLELGASDEPAQAYVDNDRRFYYKQIDTKPKYFKRDGGFFDAPGAAVETNPWRVRPAVVRDLTYPVKNEPVGTWLTDARDSFLAEVEVWDDGTGRGKLVPKAEEYDESEIMTAQAAYAEELRRLNEADEESPFVMEVSMPEVAQPSQSSQTQTSVATSTGSGNKKPYKPRWKY